WVSTYGGADVFVTLPDNLGQAKFNEQLKAFSKKHRPADYAADIFFAQSLGDMHFNKEIEVYSNHTFSRELITALTIIGIFLILIACVNFVNLATAQAVNRSKEVGVRKVLGSSRRQLAFQFISETAMITVFAIILAIGLAMACLPMLNGLMETKMKMQILNDPALVGFLLATTVSVTLLSGIYPALIVSGFNPITALKNKITARMVGGLSLRRVLVMLQFAIAHVLIIGTLVVVSQTEYFRHASLGFDKEAMLNVPLPGDSISRTRFESLRNTLLQNSGIKELSFSFTSPSDNSNWSSDFTYDHAAKRTDFGANLKWSDANYFKIYNMKFVAGHAYQPSDTVREFVVNETLLHKLGITDPNKAINKELNFWGGDKKGTIVGVVKDFNSYSLHEPMAPVVLSTWKDVYQLLNIRIKPGNEKATLAYIEKSWIAAFPDNLYSYEFLEKKIDNFYKQENQLSRLYKIFAVIAIFISCLGLYGLVSFMAVQRVKEVGIRKVLGASVRSIVYLFSRELTLLILVAFVIAAPLAYFLMRQWLQDFTYRIQLGAGVFVLSIVGSLVIAWLTVGYRSMKAAVASPVKNLRAE
ncbi:MAG TPA: FtsX-like permease family protein, partial [Chitinophagaceae bacterium]|nr:FtsX-like permease family protein [Chitinophagaceae bacterium]